MPHEDPDGREYRSNTKPGGRGARRMSGLAGLALAPLGGSSGGRVVTDVEMGSHERWAGGHAGSWARGLHGEHGEHARQPAWRVCTGVALTFAPLTPLPSPTGH